MAKPNYRFDKRQRELARQKKKSEKLLKKQARVTPASTEPDSPATPEGETT
jgi:hypothetical protein